jgi:hypothetical protein
MKKITLPSRLVGAACSILVVAFIDIINFNTGIHIPDFLVGWLGCMGYYIGMLEYTKYKTKKQI